jgi:ABC-type dipeptide/oligopeptide/nickel transport system permease subunit
LIETDRRSVSTEVQDIQQLAARPSVRPAKARGGLAVALRRNRRLVPGVSLVVLLLVSALAAPLLTAFDPTQQNIVDRLGAPSSTHLLGTDNLGRDILSRMLYAGRVSLLVGGLSVVLAAIAGSSIGLLAGHIGGGLDLFLMRLTDVFMAFPTLLLALALLAMFGGGVNSVIVAIGISTAPLFVRMTRGSMLATREKEYVYAARALGAGGVRIVLRHALPNIISPIIVLASLRLGAAILTEANLSFLGLGIAPPTPTWGNMISGGQGFITRAPWVSVFPGVAIMLTVLAFSMLGDALRDLYDPRLRRS